jgi:dihydrofolate reductase
MRTLFWQTIVSVDGYMEGPDGALDWFSGGPDFEAYVGQMLPSTGAILMGRRTYEGFAEYWPTSTDPDAAAMNGLPKVVFSRTLREVAWQNARLATREAADEVRALKAETGAPLALFASADLAETLLKAGLIDEVRLLVMPVVLGGGKPVFKDADRAKLQLLDARRMDAGTVALTYGVGESRGVDE